LPHLGALRGDFLTQFIGSQNLGLHPEPNEPSLDLPQIRNLERETPEREILDYNKAEE
jgi:hypothetical protein